jgi:hypothetical protein
MHTPSLEALWHVTLLASRMAAMTVAALLLKLAGLPCQCGRTQKMTSLKHGLARIAVRSSSEVWMISESPSTRAMSTPLNWTQVQPVVGTTHADSEAGKWLQRDSWYKAMTYGARFPANRKTKLPDFSTVSDQRPLRMMGGERTRAFKARWAAWAMSTGRRLRNASSISLSAEPPSLMTTTSVNPCGAAEWPGLGLPDGLRFWTSLARQACPAAWLRCPIASSVTMDAKERPMFGRLGPRPKTAWAGALVVLEPWSGALPPLGKEPREGKPA